MSTDERPVLSSPQLQLRADLETRLLALPYVDFVSIGFLSEAPGALLVSIGTTRPDILQALARDMVTTLMERLYEHDEDMAWNPDIHILKGRIRS